MSLASAYEPSFLSAYRLDYRPNKAAAKEPWVPRAWLMASLWALCWLVNYGDLTFHKVFSMHELRQVTSKLR
jgi:hypothetical protein